MSSPLAATCQGSSHGVLQAKRILPPPSLTHCRGYEDWRFATLELVEGILPLSLATVAMDTGTGIALGIQEVIQSVTALFSLDEDQRQRPRT